MVGGMDATHRRGRCGAAREQQKAKPCGQKKFGAVQGAPSAQGGRTLRWMREHEPSKADSERTRGTRRAERANHYPSAYWRPIEATGIQPGNRFLQNGRKPAGFCRSGKHCGFFVRDRGNTEQPAASAAVRLAITVVVAVPSVTIAIVRGQTRMRVLEAIGVLVRIARRHRQMTRLVILFGKAVRRGIGHGKRGRRHQDANGIQYGERERRPPSHSAVSAGQHQRKWSPTDLVTIRFGPKHYNTRPSARISFAPKKAPR